MPTVEQVPQILAQIKLRLNEAGDPIYVSGERLDDGWLMVAVEPTLPTNKRASEYANLMSAIERELRQTGFDEVLLVPGFVE
jgi:hypothetical protein